MRGGEQATNLRTSRLIMRFDMIRMADYIALHLLLLFLFSSFGAAAPPAGCGGGGARRAVRQRQQERRARQCGAWRAGASGGVACGWRAVVGKGKSNQQQAAGARRKQILAAF